MENKNLLVLMALLKTYTDKNIRVQIIQGYVQHYGPIPDEYGDKIRELLDR